MSQAMLSMTTALIQLRPARDHFLGLANGFWAVTILQGTSAVMGARFATVMSTIMTTVMTV